MERDVSEANHDFRGCRILVVEDDYFIATEMVRVLRGAGVDVVGPAPTAEQALVLIDANDRLDAAVLDVNLGEGKTVYPAAARLAALGVPYIFVTGDIHVRDDPTTRERPYLDKPVLERELLTAMRNLLS